MMMNRILRAAGAGESAGMSGVMDTVLSRLGLPAELAGTEKSEGRNPKAEGSPKPEARTTARPDVETAAAAALENETPEEKAVREAGEAELANETPEAKAAREAEEAAEAAAAAEPEFTAEQRAWLEARELERGTAVATEREGRVAAEGKVAELEKRLEVAGSKRVAVANLHPLFVEALEGGAGKLAEHEQKIGEFERWALANWDGVEAGADGKGGYPAGQIRQRYGELKELREKVIPEARQALAKASEGEKAGRVAYPELFDGKRPESQLAEAILQIAPGLKVLFPNIHLIIGDALRGEKLRLAAAKAKSEGRNPKAEGSQNGNRPAPRKLPAVPKAGPGLAKGAGAGAGKEAPVSAKRFMELGGDRNALVAMLSESELPTAEN